MIAVICALLISAGVFYLSHPTHPRYNDWFVIGNSVENIIQRYGDFSLTDRDADGEFSSGTYRIREDTPEWTMGYDNSLWYEIRFENGIATNVRIQHGRVGG